MWTITDAARRLGLAVSALRYWDDRGVVRPQRRQHGRRVYDDEELHRLAVAKLLRDSGMMNLDEIAVIVHGPTAGGDWRTTVRARLTAIRAQQDRLATAEGYLKHFLRCPNNDPVAGCPHLRKETAQLLEDTSARRR